MHKVRQDRAIRTIALVKFAARRIFVDRGYHAARAQDIAREANVAHGTFYLHFKNKHDCFLSLVKEAREELSAYLRACQPPKGATIEECIAAMLNALHDFSVHHSDIMKLALFDSSAVGPEGVDAGPLMNWGMEWAEWARQATPRINARQSYDWEVVGLAIVGVLQQSMRAELPARKQRQHLVSTLTCFLVGGLTRLEGRDPANG